MSKIVALILTAAAIVGGSLALAVKPSIRPQQSIQPQQVQPQQQIIVSGGRIPDGPGVPPALASKLWLGAGGDLCWGGKNGNTTITVVDGSQIWLSMKPGSQLAYIYDPSVDKVYFTVCKYQP